jgi:regulator of nucleoside diphosphate kinase
MKTCMAEASPAAETSRFLCGNAVEARAAAIGQEERGPGLQRPRVSTAETPWFARRGFWKRSLTFTIGGGTRTPSGANAMMTTQPTITDQDLRSLKKLPLGEQLAGELERANVVPAAKVPADVVTIGSRVIFVDEGTGKRRFVRIVHPDNADLARLEISVLHPVGAALLGLPVGGSIDWEFPDGQTRRLRVEELVYQPESGRSFSAVSK